MKKIFFLLALLNLIAFNDYGQTNDLHSKSHVIPCSGFSVTKPLTEIFANFDPSTIHYKNEESEDKEHRNPMKYKFHPKDGYQYDNDSSIVQHGMGTIPAKAPLMNWAGQVASGFRPFDPSGAVGPNHYVQMINSTTFKIYNKTSGAVLLTGTLGNLWSPATANNGDPIVMYDKAADRWFLAQFGSSSDKKIYIAISTTSNPTGSYYTYTYTSPAFPDYLKFSVWHDGYYMTSNQAQKVFAFNRTAMLAGTPSASSLYVSFSPPQGSGFFVPVPGDAADGTLPTSGPCPIFSYSDNGWGASYTDAINIYNMSVNWTTNTGTIVSGGSVPTSAFNAQYNASWNDCPQPGTTQKLDGIGGILMYRAQWKPWSGYNSVVLNWAVYLSASQRSIMWCELRQNPSTGVWSMYQQGIYAPDAATRWMGSIAMDNNGSIGIAYIKSDATSIYPSLCYTGRTATDPLGTFPIAETVVAVGTGYQSGMNRIGDYSQTVLDPDGITFWHTGEYFGGASGSPAKTQIFSWQISAGSTAGVSVALSSGSNPSCSGSSLTFTATPTNGGTAPSYQWKVNGNNVGTNSTTFTTTTLVSGDIVSCVMTSNLAGVLGNPATSNSITMSVTIPSTPTLSITASSSSICSGGSVTFTPVITSGGTSPTYQWKKNGTNVATGASYTTTTLVNGDVISCVLTSSLSCVTSSTATSNSITMTVSPNLTPAVTISASSSTICAGSNVVFTATPTNGGTAVYQWKLNGTNVGTNSATYSNAALTNGQVVTCTMQSSLSCTTVNPATSNAITMTVNPTVTPSITISASATTICTGNSVTFNASVVNGGSNPAYQWQVNNVNVGSNSSSYTTNTLSNGSVVKCILTSTANCANPTTVNSNSITLTVTTMPLVSAGTYTNPCVGALVSLLGSPSGGVFSGNGVSGNTFSAATTGVYPVTYTYSSGGCTNTATTNITVTPCQVSLQVKAFVQGYYLGNSTMDKTLYNQGVDPNPNTNVTDSILVELHQATSPYALVYSYHGLLKTNGTIDCIFPGTASGNSYYIVLNHRNSIRTWSALPVTMNAVTSYDFSNAASKAFGNNEILLSSNVWGLYSGDVNQDLSIDAFDFLTAYSDMQNGLFGYYVTDMNGDGAVDAFDYLVMYPNINLGVTVEMP